MAADFCADFLIIGAGMAGASMAAALAPHARVLLLEREDQPGYHSTGRSAAMFMETYGTPQVRALTRASRAFLETPPPGFAQYPLLRKRGALFVATAAQQEHLEAIWRLTHADAPAALRLDAAATCARVPVLRADQVVSPEFKGPGHTVVLVDLPLEIRAALRSLIQARRMYLSEDLREM